MIAPPAIVCVVTDRHRLGAGERTAARTWQAFEQWLDDVILAGPDLIQVRERDLEARALCDLCRRLVDRSRDTSVQVVVNSRADVALAAAARGVHLPASGPPAARVRAIGPERWILGRSTHTVGEVMAHQDADYLIFGTLFQTPSKPDGSPLSGVHDLASAAAASARPVLAIGGLTVERAVEARRAGAAGIAAITLFLPAGSSPSALGPARAVAALRAAMLE